MRSTRFLALVVFVLLPVLAGCSGGGSGATQEPSRRNGDTAQSFLFILQAAGATLSAEDPSQKTLAFTLKDPDPVVIFLSDRPKRLVGHVPLALFLQGWNVLGFNQQPPNAAAIVSEAALKEDPVIVELNRPEWNPAARSLSFQARIVQNDRNPEAAFSSPISDIRLPASFGHLSLFIDTSRPNYFNKINSIASPSPAPAGTKANVR